MMRIEPHEIQIWSTDLDISESLINTYLTLLSPDECERANRYHFPIHRQRFIAARGMLRTLISLYTNTPPQDIIFAYDDHEKPFLKNQIDSIQFNVSHSHDIALYAFTLNHAIGIDIEKTKDHFNDDVAKRYFSAHEYHALSNLTPEEKINGFYRIWSRKEAVIKAIGKGLSLPLSSFSVSVNDDFEEIMIDNKSWSLFPVFIHSDYQSAVATNQKVKMLSYWRLIDHIPKLLTVNNL